MIVSLVRLVGVVLIFTGAFFFIAATVGVIRMTDPYNRGHVAGKGDSPGFLLSLIGIWLYWMTISPTESIKVLIITMFMLLANPIAIHSILRLCYRQGVKFCDGTVIIKEAKDGKFTNPQPISTPENNVEDKD
jgi:multicomponent Na+:H+ antiporter subunit G